MTLLSISKILKIKNIKKYKNKIITINGWIKTLRNSKIGISFIDINDGSSINNIQIIVKKDLNNYNKIKKLTSGCAIKIMGIIIKNKKTNNYEINVNYIKILGKINNPKKYPLSPKYHSLEYLRKISHLRSKTKLFGAISRIRNTFIFNLHKYLQSKNFLLINTPIITSLDTEGHSKMFNIKYKNNNFFNKKSYLSVSGQLNLESYACSLSKVYNIGPIFRAENSNTKKHLSEFWMLETEIAFYKLNKIISLSKNILSYCIKQTLKHNKQDIYFLLNFNKSNNINHITNIIEKKFIEIDYYKIINILKKQKIFKNDNIRWGISISTIYEKFLTEKYFKNALIIKNYPKKIKPFYMKTNKDNKTVSCIDILLPNIGEIIGGSVRENDINKLDKNIKKNKLNKKQYNWYRDLRKYGNTPHSGFGLGIERIIMYITKMQNIRDVIPFPKYPNYSNF